ncbi:DUF2877 domain-containing protein [Virgibacillus halophilus]|uniref:DUF2877 domain-containing protein n=1 Tax=Tigheibacillus halophilus TaxID=361280 RepID=A0ABU5C1W2_9BACI|nr:DUF2877 domain-containing protein [Virgibacillus halophilus]
MQHLEGAPCQNESEQNLRRLIDVVFSSQPAEIEEVLRFLIGRGKGLTPSGDDHLVGMLAVLYGTNQHSGVFLQVLKQLVYNGKLTTDVGREYLRYAINGQFSSTVTEVVDQLMNDDQQLLKSKMRRLIEMGHSSGADTLFGMLIGLLAIRRK